MAGFSGVVSPAACGRTYRRWVLFTGGFRWQQGSFNAMAQYGCDRGMTQVQRRDNAFNRLSLLVPCLTCPTILGRSRTATGAQIRGSALLSYFFTFLLCIERKLKARMRAMGAITCPLCSCVRGAGEGWTVGQVNNGAACACPTALNGSRTRPDSRTAARGLTPRVMQPSPSACRRCAGGLRAGAGSKCPDYIRSGCTSATGSFRGCSSAHARRPTAAAAGAC